MTSTPNPAILTLTGAPEGIVRLFVPTGIDVSKGELRTVAQKAAHTIDVGRTPAGKPGHVTRNGTKVNGYVFDFSPVKRSGGTESTEATPEQAPADDPRLAALLALGLTPEQAATALGMASEAASKSGKGTSTGRTAKPESDFHKRMVARAQAREAQAAATCPICLGYGKRRAAKRTRKTDGQPVKYPWAFRQQHGADTSPTGVPCECRGGAKVTA